MDNATVFLNGLFVPLKNARVSILDRGFCYGDGLFETMRAYRGTVFKVGSHLDRLFDSLEKIYLDLPMTRKEVASAILETLDRNYSPEAMVRLTVSRGEQIPGFAIDPGGVPTVVIHVRPYIPVPAHWNETGVQITLFPGSCVRTSGLDRQVKSCNYLSQIILRERAAKNNAVEGIMVDPQNKITEGTVSNIFLVRRNELITPALNEYILPGITRQVVIDIAREQGLPCSEREVPCEELEAADEVFLTNSGFEILPVCRIDDKIIGSGKPGTMTRFVQKEFLKTVEGEEQKC